MDARFVIGILIVAVLVLLYQVHELRDAVRKARSDCVLIQKAVQHREKEYSDLEVALSEAKDFSVPQRESSQQVVPASETTGAVFETPASVDYPTPRHEMTFPENTPKFNGDVLPANETDSTFASPL